jgi:hypothetical protein
VAQYFTVKAESNAELQAFLQALKWVDDAAIEIVYENPRAKEALIVDKADNGGYEDVVIYVPVRGND